MANADIVRNAASIVSLDRELAKYGPETQEVGALLKRTYATTMKTLVSGNLRSLQDSAAQEGGDWVEDLQRKLKALSPHTEDSHLVNVATL